MMPAQPNAYHPSRSSNPQPPRASAQPKAPVVRAQAPESQSLSMPAPESFGIRLGHKDEAPLDWNNLRQQLDRLGVSSFQLEKHGSGYRFACRISNGVIEGLGASEAEAVRMAMAKVNK